MKSLRLASIFWVAATAAAGATLNDVSNQSSLQLNPGDALYFLISNLSLPERIDSVEFQIVTLPLAPGAQFEAELTSRDGSIAMSFMERPQVAGGDFRGAGYSGPVSVISGRLWLAGPVFQNTHAILVLRDAGSPLVLGVPGYTVPQDLNLTLTNGLISVGVISGGAFYAPAEPTAAAPEPDTGVVLCGLGAVLCLFSRTVKRISYRSIE